jgi:hypothetical protein
METEMCPECNGEGEVVICVDDCCVAAGECMHGSGGMAVCPECDGTGVLTAQEMDHDYYESRGLSPGEDV